MYPRLCKLSKSYSLFLFGPRGTGKTTLLEETFSWGEDSYYINLLDLQLEDRFSRHPEEFTQMVKALPASVKYIVVDEIQKLPKLLDLVHQLIQQHKKKRFFIMTGSSARKLKYGSANLLAGRAFVYQLFPLSYRELKTDFDLDHYLNWGGLPEIYSFKSAEDKKRYLNSYVLTYLKEEVWSEQLIRSLDPFRNFLELCALSSGEIINHSKLSQQTGVSYKTIQSYYQILVDTLLGFYLEPYETSVRKRTVKSPKFFLIDTGVKKALANALDSAIVPKTYAYGKAFEHFFITQCYFLSHYYETSDRFFYLKTETGVEIDLIIQRSQKELILIELKSSRETGEKDVKSFIEITSDFEGAQAYCFSLDPMAREVGGVLFRHYLEGLEMLYPPQI